MKSSNCTRLIIVAAVWVTLAAAQAFATTPTPTPYPVPTPSVAGGPATKSDLTSETSSQLGNCQAFPDAAQASLMFAWGHCTGSAQYNPDLRPGCRAADQQSDRTGAAMPVQSGKRLGIRFSSWSVRQKWRADLQQRQQRSDSVYAGRFGYYVRRGLALSKTFKQQRRKQWILS